jgi:hypothetical protein
MISKALYASRFVRVAGFVVLAGLIAGVAFSYANGSRAATGEQECVIDSAATVKSCCAIVPQSRGSAFTAPPARTTAAERSDRPAE